jgi:hypothetical protein
MATLISSHNSNGCTGRCDANCQDATSPAHTCDCICGGMNHGVGLKKAQDNTTQYANDWMNKWEKEHQGDKCKIEQKSFQEQLPLFK